MISRNSRVTVTVKFGLSAFDHFFCCKLQGQSDAGPAAAAVHGMSSTETPAEDGAKQGEG